MKDLTTNQSRVLEYIVQRAFDGQPLPQAREICEYMSLRSATSGYQYLNALAAHGYLDVQQHGRGLPAEIRLTRKALRYLLRTPLVEGYIPAGDLDYRENGGEDPAHIVGIQELIPSARPGDFLIRVKGDSMIDAGIRDGEYALIRPSRKPRQGDICAVWVEGEGGTLKSVFQEGETVRLVPFNPKYTTQIFPASEVKIQGVLVATLNIAMHQTRKGRS